MAQDSQYGRVWDHPISRAIRWLVFIFCPWILTWRREFRDEPLFANIHVGNVRLPSMMAHDLLYITIPVGLGMLAFIVWQTWRQGRGGMVWRDRKGALHIKGMEVVGSEDPSPRSKQDELPKTLYQIDGPIDLRKKEKILPSLPDEDHELLKRLLEERSVILPVIPSLSIFTEDSRVRLTRLGFIERLYTHDVLSAAYALEDEVVPVIQDFFTSAAPRKVAQFEGALKVVVRGVLLLRPNHQDDPDTWLIRVGVELTNRSDTDRMSLDFALHVRLRDREEALVLNEKDFPLYKDDVSGFIEWLRSPLILGPQDSKDGYLGFGIPVAEWVGGYENIDHNNSDLVVSDRISGATKEVVASRLRTT